MLLRPFRPIICTRSLTSARKGISVEIVGKRADVALVSIADPTVGDLPYEICELVAAHEADASIRSTIVALTSAFAPPPLKDYGSFIKIANCTKPTIALIDGAIGGVATELAMSCDIIYASDRSSFALDQMALSGEPLAAGEAKEAGLVSKVLPIHRLLKEGIRLGDRAGEKSALIQPMAKEAVAAAFETTLREGLRLESRLFEATFATKDRKEGMTAHFERRKPEWRGE